VVGPAAWLEAVGPSYVQTRMRISKTLDVADRAAWRAWLKKHHRSEQEIWLVYYRKHAAKPRLPYNVAVEEALCFGWIDSTVKALDAERFAQRFSPRKPARPYSQTNKERLRRLIRQGRVVKGVLDEAEKAVAEDFRMPPDILKALKANRQAWRHFRTYSPAYQRIRIAYIESARARPLDFRRRLQHFLRMTEQGKQFGFGIESFY